MYCKNCGKEIPDGSEKCPDCGYELNKSKSEQTITKEIVKKSQGKFLSKKKKIALIVVGTIAIIGFGINYFVSKSNNPEKIIKEYMAATVSNDYETIYDFLNLENTKFLSKDIYLSSQKADESDEEKDELDYIEIAPATTEQIKDNDAVLKKGDVAYYVTYGTQLHPRVLEEVVVLNQSHKKFLLFNDYKVEPTNYILSDYVIEAPTYAKVHFDGVELTKDYLSKDDDEKQYRNSFVIPEVFNGEHKIEVTSDYTDKYEDTVDIYNHYASYEKEKYTCPRSMVIKSDLQTKINEKIESTLKTFCEGIKNDKSFDEIMGNLDIVESQKESISEKYNELKEGAISGHYYNKVKYKELNFLGLSDSSIASYWLTQLEDNNNDDCWNTDAPLSGEVYFKVNYDVEDVSENITYFYKEKSGEDNRRIRAAFAVDGDNLKLYSIG